MKLAPIKLLAVQAIQLVAMVVALLVLIPFCLRRAWTRDAVSIKDGRSIDRWNWRPLNYVCGNPEDGVSGQTAKLIGGGPYMPDANPIWRAYCWSALRNSVDNLKYVFAWHGDFAPLWSYRWQVGSYIVHGKAGWQPENGYNVPVFSPIKFDKVWV